MRAVELRWNAGEAAAPGAGGSPTDYHALGAFAETWAFLELFLGRCAETVGVTPQGDAQSRALTLALAVQAAPEFAPLAGKTSALAHEIAELAAHRQVVMEDLARASLRRMGVEACNAPPPASPVRALDALHMGACDLVRRCVILLGQLKARRGGSA